MASRKLTQLGLVTSIGNSDLFYIVQDLGTVPTSYGVEFSLISSTIGGGGGASGLTLVEHKTITTNSTTVTFSGLNGNTDGNYLLKGKVINNAGSSVDLLLRPNGITTNQTSEFSFADNAIQQTPQSSSNLRLANISNGKWFSFRSEIDARANPNSIGAQRLVITNGTTTFTTATTVSIGSVWDETSTNITSLDIVSSVSNGIGDGSEFWLYKYAQ